MARAGLQGTPSLTRPSRSRRHSFGCSVLQTHSLSVEPQAREATKWPREVSPTRQSESQTQHSQLRSRSRSRWHQSPLPEYQRQSSSWSPNHKVWSSKWATVSPYVKTWSCRLEPRSTGVGCGKAEPPPWLKKTPRSRSDSTSMKRWAVNLPCPQAWFSSCLGERSSSDIPLLPLLQHCLLIHHSLTMKKAPSGVPSTPEEPDPKSSHLLPNPHRGQRDQIQLATPTGGSMWKCWRSPTYPGGKPWCPVARGQCSLIPHESLNELKALHLAHRQVVVFQLPWTQQEAAGWGPLHLQSMGFTSKDYMPSPISSDFQIMRQQEDHGLS